MLSVLKWKNGNQNGHCNVEWRDKKNNVSPLLQNISPTNAFSESGSLGTPLTTNGSTQYLKMLLKKRYKYVPSNLLRRFPNHSKPEMATRHLEVISCTAHSPHHHDFSLLGNPLETVLFRNRSKSEIGLLQQGLYTKVMCSPSLRLLHVSYKRRVCHVWCNFQPGHVSDYQIFWTMKGSIQKKIIFYH